MERIVKKPWSYYEKRMILANLKIFLIIIKILPKRFHDHEAKVYSQIGLTIKAKFIISFAYFQFLCRKKKCCKEVKKKHRV